MARRTLSELAELCGAVLEGDPARTVTGPASLSDAGPEEVSFCAQPRYRRELERTRAGAVVVPQALEVERRDLALLRCRDASRAFSKVVESFAPERWRPEPGVHTSAVVDPSASLHPGAAVGALCVIGPECELAAGVVLHPRVTLGARVRLGERTEIHPGAVLYDGVSVGAGCLIHAGAVLGADGYGFEPGPGGWDKIPQCGTVVLEDEVEVGANTTIDRGRFGATRIARGVKLDNLVHVGHNVVVEEGAMLAAQVGVSGSARIGRGALLGGQSGVGGHIAVGAGARLAGQSGAIGDVPPGADWLGMPARDRRETLRGLARIARLGELEARLRALERRAQEERP
jgi:UDP-3-O-[3-hydroxymyristoyl] glucosamine N-acyltransferase